MRKGPRRAPPRHSQDLERLLELPVFSSRLAKRTLRAYGLLGAEAAAVLIAAAYQDRFAEYLHYLDEGVQEIGEYAPGRFDELESYIKSLSVDLGIVKK